MSESRYPVPAQSRVPVPPMPFTTANRVMSAHDAGYPVLLRMPSENVCITMEQAERLRDSLNATLGEIRVCSQCEHDENWHNEHRPRHQFDLGGYQSGSAP